MANDELYRKAQYSLEGALLFAILASPFTVRQLQKVLSGVTLVTSGGELSYTGLALLSFIYFILVFGLMLIPH